MLAGCSLRVGAAAGRTAVAVAELGEDRLDHAAQLGQRLDGQRQCNRRLWRRLARAPEALAGRPVARPLPGSAELPSAARRALWSHRSQAGTLPKAGQSADQAIGQHTRPIRRVKVPALALSQLASCGSSGRALQHSDHAAAPWARRRRAPLAPGGRARTSAGTRSKWAAARTGCAPVCRRGAAPAGARAASCRVLG